VIAAAGQAILHATVAALLIGALLRWWRVEDPGERLAMRWVAMAAPALLSTMYLVFAPWRTAPWFVDGWALFAGAHWEQLRIGGAGVASAAAVVLSVLGTALYLRDTVPFLADRLVRSAPDRGLPGDHPASARVRRALDAVHESGPGRPSSVTVVDDSSPVLLCTGIDRTAIVISTGTLDRLDDDSLAAALAHEVAHLATRDPLAGWWLMTARTLQFFNPVVQVVARQAVQDLERRADVTVAEQGRACGLASAVRRLSLAADVHSDLALASDGGRLASRVLWSAHRRGIDDRCRLLLENVVPARRPLRAWRIALASAGLAALLFLVV
jgi:Zn-dependent protease with chaperone function